MPLRVQQAFVLDRSAPGSSRWRRLRRDAPPRAFLYRLFPDNPEALERLSLLQAASGNLAKRFRARR
jgi:hypothetical protein